MQLGPGGCSVDKLMFSNFQYTAIPSFTLAPDPSAILVNPDRTPILGNSVIGGGSGSGLDFGFNRVLMPVPNPATQDFTTPSLAMTISFDVGSLSGLGRATTAPQLSADPMATAAATLTIGSVPCASADAAQGLPGASGCALGGTRSAQVVENIRLVTAPVAGAGAQVKSVATRWTDAGEPSGASAPPPAVATDPSPTSDEPLPAAGVLGNGSGNGSGTDSAVPEPGTWMLLGLGMGLIALGGRRERRS